MSYRTGSGQFANMILMLRAGHHMGKTFRPNRFKNRATLEHCGYHRHTMAHYFLDLINYKSLFIFYDPKHFDTVRVRQILRTLYVFIVILTFGSIPVLSQ